MAQGIMVSSSTTILTKNAAQEVKHIAFLDLSSIHFKIKEQILITAIKRKQTNHQAMSPETSDAMAKSEERKNY